MSEEHRRGEEFLELVHETVVSRGRIADYLNPAVRLAVRIPENVSPTEACDIFERWYYGDTQQPGDERLRRLLPDHP